MRSGRCGKWHFVKTMVQTVICKNETSGFETAIKAVTVTLETLESLTAVYSDPGSRLRWPCPFVLPLWLYAWWQSFGEGRPEILTVRRCGEPIGVAPLMIQGQEARLLGDPNVCDHLDVSTAPEETENFLLALCDHLRRRGVDRLDFELLRPDSIVIREMAPAARRGGFTVEIEPKDESIEVELPDSWESYLLMLNGKQRHEMRRKLRRLEAAGPFTLRSVTDEALLSAAMGFFFRLFHANRRDKADFMQPAMTAYFRRLLQALAAEGRLRLFFLELRGVPAAAAMCFHHQQTMYLYNSAYDQRFRDLSVGLLCKFLSIRESIRSGMKIYDLLRGAEAYKRRLGGHSVTLYRCMMAMNAPTGARDCAAGMKPK